MENDVGLTKNERRALAREEKEKEHERAASSSKGKKLLLYLVIAAIAGWFGYKFVAYLRSPVSEVPAQVIDITESDWVKGDREGKAILVEYGDFQCPACALYYPYTKRLAEEVAEGLQVVYRHMPLPQHANAMPAAKASEAAGKQGKFWEMHDVLYEKQSDWDKEKSPDGKFESYAQDLGLNLEQYKNDYTKSEVEEKIKADILSANRFNVDATPTFFLNGKKIQPGSYEEFKSLVEAEINF